jgi:hypothetical protein
MRKATLFLIIILLSPACAGAGEGDPADIVEKYLQAKVDGEIDIIGTLLCSAMEANLERESRTFESVSDVRVVDMACERVEDSDTVSCEGKIVALYGAEETEFPLASFRVVQEDGEWKWCGEAP